MPPRKADSDLDSRLVSDLSHQPCSRAAEEKKRVFGPYPPLPSEKIIRPLP